MRLKKIIKLFEQGNVMVYGVKGSGKDMLTANVVVRRKLPYLSNVDYGGMYMPLDLATLDCGKNTYENFISGDIIRYQFPYPDKTDIYISDSGVYFPAQHCNELNRRYPYFATTQALLRHIGDCALHSNAQSLCRVWDKIREQSEQYILCRGCWVLFGGKLVIQRVRIYDLYESALNKTPPMRLSVPTMNREAKAMAKMHKEQYKAAHGNIKSGILIYRNKSKYNTRFFKELLMNGNAEYVAKR